MHPGDPGEMHHLLLHPKELIRDPDFKEALVVAAVSAVITLIAEALFGRIGGLAVIGAGLPLYMLVRLRDAYGALCMLGIGMLMILSWSNNARDFGMTVFEAGSFLCAVVLVRYEYPSEWEGQRWRRWCFRFSAAFLGWWLYTAVPNPAWRWTAVAIYAALYLVAETLPIPSREHQ
jgi:hypothetical protein